MVRPVSSPSSAPGSCFDCRAHEHSPWCKMANGALAELDEAKLLLSYRPGQLIFMEGDPCRGIYCIQSGTVAVRKVGPSEADSVVGLHHAGETLGYDAFVTDRPFRSTAEATTETRICYIERSTLKAVIEAHPTIAHRFLEEMVARTDDAQMMLVACRELPVRARLANSLLLLRNRYASIDEEGCLRFELPVSRGLLASLVGARPESLSRAIQALERAGVAEFRGRTVLVHDLDDLLDEIEGSPNRA